MLTVNNEIANIIKNNATVNAAYVACVIAHYNYNAYSPLEYNAKTVAQIAHLESEYNNAVKAYKVAIKAAKANA